MKDKDELFRLIEKYKQNACSDQEKSILERWFHELASDDLTDLEEEKLQQVAAEMWTVVRPKANGMVSYLRNIKYPLAAAVALFFLISVLFWNIRSNQPSQIHTTEFGPAGNKATLKIANSNTIALRGDRTSVVVSGGSLTYEDGSPVMDAALPANTILELATPRGGWYTSILPDGTKVWINAASSLKYPKEFTGNQRNVELQGEAYFEVAKDTKKPFHVRFKQGDLIVTGTKFNIKTYTDEPETAVSLVEGGVRVENASDKKMLLPKQQASFSRQSVIRIKPIDLKNVLAWKDGSFVFEDLTIYQIMSQVSRWYDVDVEFVGPIHTAIYGGYYTRSKGLKDLLDYLGSLDDFNFKLVERRVIVTAK